MRRRWERLNGPGRIAGVDLARGLAVIGMLAAHLLYTPDEARWDDPASWMTVVDGRSSILFAMLAGLSMGLVTGAERPLDELRPARSRLAWRAGILWLIGVLLILTGVPVYVILPAYAILFLLALPFLRLQARTVLALALALGLAMPLVQPLLDDLPIWQSAVGADLAAAIGWAYPFPVWIAFVLAGLGLARLGVRRRAVQWAMLGGGLAAATLGYGLMALGSPQGYWTRVWTAAPHSSGLGEVIGSGGFAVAVLGACLLLCTRAEGRTTVFGWIALPLRATGAMPLSAYVGQLLIWALVAAIVLGDSGDLYGFRALEPFWPMTIGIVAGCTLWALLLGRGPLEWLTERLVRLLVRGRAIDRLDA